MPKRALLSVYNKASLVDFGKRLSEAGYDLVSTGGTQRALEEAKISVTAVEEVTGEPERFSGRVKTLHPGILGAILFDRGDKDHVSEAGKAGVTPIDLVCVNLYPFAEALEKSGLEADLGSDAPLPSDLIEQIDIGGVTLLRAAAKNCKDVVVVCDPADYDAVADEIAKSGDVSLEARSALAAKAFAVTATYDACITEAASHGRNTGIILGGGQELRYGENPHQWGRFYAVHGEPAGWTVLQEEKKMSYLNILDADSAMNLVCEFKEPTAACIKHANPSGVASGDDIADAFQRSYDADRLSAFGVIVALNRECPAAVIEKICEQKIFTEVIIAPSYSDEVTELLKKKPKIRAIAYGCPEGGEDANTCDRPVYRSMLGGVLVQNKDTKVVTESDLTCVTEKKPSENQVCDLLFAWKVVKHAKSNAIVYAKGNATVGIGCGQTSRVDSAIIASRRAGENAKGAVMASDAFFPFPDSVEEAAKNGIVAIIQPGGSIRDEEVIAKANELGVPMVVTGVRGFRH